MTASVRLRELEPLLLTFVPTGGPDPSLLIYLALPEIIEVVEQAEKYSKAALHWTEDSSRQKKMRAALTALDAKLSA